MNTLKNILYATIAAVTMAAGCVSRPALVNEVGADSGIDNLIFESESEDVPKNDLSGNYDPDWYPCFTVVKCKPEKGEATTSVTWGSSDMNFALQVKDDKRKLYRAIIQNFSGCGPVKPEHYDVKPLEDEDGRCTLQQMKAKSELDVFRFLSGKVPSNTVVHVTYTQ